MPSKKLMTLRERLKIETFTREDSSTRYFSSLLPPNDLLQLSIYGVTSFLDRILGKGREKILRGERKRNFILMTVNDYRHHACYLQKT